MLERHTALAMDSAITPERRELHRRAVEAHRVAHLTPALAERAVRATSLAFDGGNWNEGEHDRADNGQFGATSVHSSEGKKTEAQHAVHKSFEGHDFKESPPNSMGKHGDIRNYSGKKLGKGATASHVRVEPTGAWKHHEIYTVGTPDKELGSGKDHNDLKTHLARSKEEADANLLQKKKLNEEAAKRNKKRLAQENKNNSSWKWQK